MWVVSTLNCIFIRCNNSIKENQPKIMVIWTLNYVFSFLIYHSFHIYLFLLLLLLFFVHLSDYWMHYDHMMFQTSALNAIIAIVSKQRKITNVTKWIRKTRINESYHPNGMQEKRQINTKCALFCVFFLYFLRQRLSYKCASVSWNGYFVVWHVLRLYYRYLLCMRVSHNQIFYIISLFVVILSSLFASTVV